MHEYVKMKLKLEWRSQELRDASNVDSLPRKTVGCGESQAKREATEAASSKVKGMGLPKAFGNNTSQSCVLHAVHTVTGPVCQLGFNLAFGPHRSSYHPFLPFRMGMFLRTTIYWIYVNLFLIFTKYLRAEFVHKNVK